MKNLSILVVDDDPVIRLLLERRLIKENYKVQVAEDGYTAEKLLNSHIYDVVLTDLMMPGEEYQRHNRSYSYYSPFLRGYCRRGDEERSC